ncbi:MAG: creatininase family protein [bacterium]|nr:creatininase family protein [bacterium]
MIIGEVRLWKLTRRQVREAMRAAKIKGAILPTGSTEQHNEHLEMEHDTASALYVSHQAALGLYPQVVVATPMAVGISEHWMEFPGTLSLRPDTFVAVAYDICESLQRHGVEHILVVNGHAGNRPLANHMEDFGKRLGIDVQFCSYWEAYSEDFVQEILDSGDCPAHAAEFETSLAMAAFPENIHWEGVDYEGANLKIQREGYADRDPIYFRDGRDLATPKKGRVMADEAISWVANKMQGMIDG